MRKVYQAEIMTDAALIRDMLGEAGIRAQVLAGELLDFWVPDRGATSPTQVWVSEADVDRALELIRRHERSLDGSAQTSWRCRGCREDNPGQFGVCWSCGAARTW